MFLFDVLNNCAVHSVDDPSRSNLEIDAPCLDQLEHGVYREPFQRSTTGDGAIMPRGTLVLGPFDHFEFTASAGNGIRSVDPSYVSWRAPDALRQRSVARDLRRVVLGAIWKNR